MFEPNRNLRPAGVKVATAQDLETGPPQTLEHIAPMQFFGLQYFDERGARRRLVVTELYGRYYAAPNSEEWATKLKPLSKWITDQIEKKGADQRPVEVPTDDSVDVMAGGS